MSATAHLTLDAGAQHFVVEELADHGERARGLPTIDLEEGFDHHVTARVQDAVVVTDCHRIGSIEDLEHRADQLEQVERVRRVERAPKVLQQLGLDA